jgi:hypothetical protein
MGIYDSSGQTRDPLGIVALGVGAIAAGCAIVMWAYQADPNSALVRSVSERLGAGALLGDRLVTVSLVAGALAVGLGVIASIGGRAKGTAVAALVLGAIGLSYPVLTSLDLIRRPLERTFS